MLKIRIRTLIPIRRDSKKNNYLKPGEYDAEVTEGGGLYIYGKFGEYEILPGQFEAIKAPRQLLEYWRHTFRLIDAQAKYCQEKTYVTACILQSVQGKHEVAKQRFGKLFAKEGLN
ncbi:MAG: hypothetical protein FWC97_00490 [Treponema sp.]|nr:hypothetical protein [Treponema sp.]